MAEATNAPAPAPKPGTPEYDAAMVAKFDNAGVAPDKSADEPSPQPQPQPATRPEWFPENLWKADKSLEENSKALAASYAEARKTISQKPASQPAAQSAAPQVDPAKKQLEDALAAVKAKPDAKPEEIQAAEKALADYKPAAPQVLPANVAEFEQEFAEKGELSAESYAKLEKLGFGKDIVDSYIEGQKARVAAWEAKAHSAVGGKEKFEQMTAWASTGLSPAEIDAFNDAMVSGNEAQMMLAIQGVQAKFSAANGTQPALLGGSKGTDQVAGFRSQAEMTAAMSDPRYKKDPAYRADVEKRVGASTFW